MMGHPLSGLSGWRIVRNREIERQRIRDFAAGLFVAAVMFAVAVLPAIGDCVIGR